MKNFVRNVLTFLAALLLAPTVPMALAQSYTAQSGVSLLTQQSATATFTSSAVRLPNFSGVGVMTVTAAGITGSPSGCTIALAYQSNNATTATAAVSTTSFTPATGVTQFFVSPSAPTGDSFVATYACSSTYPTAGTLTVSFSPSTISSIDPCITAPKSSVSVAISTATTTQLVAPVTGKAVYFCAFTATVGATTTAQFEYGTGSSCGTGTTALTGVFAPSTGSVLSIGGETTRMAVPVSNALCAVSTGTGGINGVLTYVQQ